MAAERNTNAHAHDAVIVGGGIAGASLACTLARRGMTDVVLLERAHRPGYHASGRSAQILLELDFDPCIRRMLVEGGELLRRPPPGFSETPIFRQSGALVLLDEPDWTLAHRLLPEWRQEGTPVEAWSPADAARHVPVLARDCGDGALYFPEAGRLDVSELMKAYLSVACREGVEARTGEVAAGIIRDGARCAGVITERGERLRARWVIDAAGAWAGEVAALAQATPIALRPMRRTIATFDAPAGLPVHRWPVVSFASRGVYFATEGDRMLVCPMDQTPRPPEDAYASEEDIELALARLERWAPAMKPARIRSTRAGLRTFSPDRRFVVGEDPCVPGFFWLAGQGGWGIESSAALASMAAEQIVEERSSHPLAAAFSPARFA